MNNSEIDIETETLNNTYFRKVISTSSNLQVVVMAIPVGEKIDEEIHKISDQFFKIEDGECEIYIDKNKYVLKKNDIIIVPKNTLHKVVNISSDILKLYTIYSPPHHPIGTIHESKQDAIKSEERIYTAKIKKYEQKLNELKKIESIIH
jgi:mannose-6-phosphate isomerase-like protein (cupin superfamily)